MKNRHLFMISAALQALLLALQIGCTKSDSSYTPVRIASYDSTSLLVSGYADGTVLRYDKSSGSAYPYLPIGGTPLGIAAANNSIYVGNEATSSIDVYNSSGLYRGTIGTPGSIKSPSDIAIDPLADRLFVVDGIDNNVKVFTLAGSLVRTFAGPPSVPGALLHPTGIVIDTVRQEVFVSDYGDPADQTTTPSGVHTFGYDGAYKRSIIGHTTGGFTRPQGMALDGGHLFVADSVLGQVLVFDSLTGTPLTILGSFGSGTGELFLPLDVVVEPVSRNVYVTDNRNGRITVFVGGGVLP